MADQTWTAQLDTSQLDAPAIRSAAVVAALEKKLDDLRDAQSRNAITSAEFAQGHARITQQLQAEQAALQGYNSALSGQYGATQQASGAAQQYAKGLKDVGGAAGRGGAAGGILLLSQIVDDAQYGLTPPGRAA